MGPWYILLDEFLVSGETIVRDLQMGLARSAAFGGPMDVGYLPDMFGHVAQMPQILRLAGFEHAVVWRGVPSAITKTGFWWEAPDGSSVRAEYLPVGYSNGAVLPDDPKSLVRRIEDHEQEIASFLIDDLLLMNGSDHLPPQPFLGRVVAEANDLQDDYTFEITSLPGYLATAPTEGLERWEGELRSGARANVLMGVTSNRVDVKRAAGITERQLERRAEPYAALFLAGGEWPERLLELAWLGVVRNAAHDSICACSVDDVVDAVLHRFAESRAIAEGVASRALTALSRSMAEPGHVIVNPSARARTGMVELVVDADNPAGPDVQILSERFGLPGSMTLDAETVRTILGMLQGPKIDNDAWVQDVRVDEDETGIDLTVAIGPEERPNVPIAEAKADLYTRLGARPDVSVRVRLEQPPIRRIAARATQVPGFGWRAFEPAVLAHPVTAETIGAGAPDQGSSGGSPAAACPTVRSCCPTAWSRWWSTQPTAPSPSMAWPAWGSWWTAAIWATRTTTRRPRKDSMVDAPVAVTVAVGERGPVRATAVITATYRWPDHVEGGSQARVGEHTVDIVTTLDVRADERPVRVTTAFFNPSRDHRLRVHLPLPRPASVSEAECAFTTVTRGLTVEGRPDELGLPTFPARRFVSAGGLTVVHDGVVEYELIDIDGAADAGTKVADGAGHGAHTLALTLLRSTGMLSRVGMAYRPFPAGPLTSVPGLQLVGRTIEARYAVVVGDVDPWSLADDILLPLEVVSSLGGGGRGAEGSALQVEGAEVTAVRRERGQLEVRVCNPSDEATTVRTGGRQGWLVDLRGRPLSHFDGSFELRPYGIATFRLPGD